MTENKKGKSRNHTVNRVHGFLSMQSQGHINILPDHVVNKIAAGEVVERPAAALKELVENSLDAGGAQLDVEVVSGGRNLVKVVDDGPGMSRDDALLSIERHATSKILDVDDIDKIMTLGFRGEALAAISAVSRFCLRTRRKGDLAGTEITVSAGKIQDVRDAGCSEGTCVEVRNLFFNVPARRKFLRSEQTELSHLRHVFTTYALSHPQVGMTFKVDGRQIYALPGAATFEERLRDLFPAVSELAIRQVDYATDEVKISGYISHPTQTTSNPREQYLFVNGRPCVAPILNRAIREGYHSLLARDRYPVTFLFLTVDPALVDVNVHPTKKEIRFRNLSGVRNAAIEAIRRALTGGTADGAGEIKKGFAKPITLSVAPGSSQAGFQSFSRLKTAIPSKPLRYPDQLALPSEDGIRADKQRAIEKKAAAPDQAGASGQGEFQGEQQDMPWTWFKIMGQVNERYVVMEMEDGLVLMDPHAAHERVLFERLMRELKRGKIRSQGMLIAETVELMPKAALCVRRQMAIIKKMGFGIAEFGGDTFVLDAVPACLPQVALRFLLADIAAELDEVGERRGTEMLIEECIAQAACKSAVKALGQLKKEEIEGLVLELARTEMPYTCPHGRPTLIHISFQELDKKFGRT